MPAPHLKAVLFDLYDTLAWIDVAALRPARERLARAAGISLEQLLEYSHETLEDRRLGRLGDLAAEFRLLLKRWGVEERPGLVQELVQFELGIWRDSVKLYDDALPVLRYLRARDVRTAIVSNCTHQAGAMVAQLELEPEVDRVVLSCSAGVAKPDPAIYELTLERLGAAADPTTLLVDDLEENLDPARDALRLRTAHLVRRGVERPLSNNHPRIASLNYLESALDAA